MHPSPLARAGFALLAACTLFAAAPPLRFVLENRTQGPSATVPVYLTITGQDASGRPLRMAPDGTFHPCRPGDAAGPGGRAPYSFPAPTNGILTMDRTGDLVGGRLYLSFGSPLFLRVDPATGGLVQPDPANPGDPNCCVLFDWIEFTLAGGSFNGNTTCVDMFGLPITLAVRDGHGAEVGPVGLDARRSDLMAAFRTETAAPFHTLVQPDGMRILAPGHAPTGALATWLDPYLTAMWARYRTTPLVLTPGDTYVGHGEPGGALVFNRAGDPTRHVIRARPTTVETYRCDGPLAEGTPIERMLGAQVAALLNRHLLERPDLWRSAAAYYLTSPTNDYARFWHRHGLGGKAYGFPYDDVNDQSTFIHVDDPTEIRLGFRID